MIRAVLDTNVIISSLIQPTGVPHQLVDAWKRDLFTLCLSTPLLEDLHEVLARPSLLRLVRIKPEQVDEFLELVAETSEFVLGPLQIESVIKGDPDDDAVLATALAGEADFIVSGDGLLLSLKEYRGILIVTPRQFLDILRESSSLE